MKLTKYLLTTSALALPLSVHAAVVTGTFSFVEDNSALSNADAAQAPWTVDTITIASTVYSDLIAPSAYDRVLTDPADTGLSGTGEIRLNGLALNPDASGTLPIGSSAPRLTPTSTPNIWDAQATIAFQSHNLNYMQQIDGGNNDHKWRLNYGAAGVIPNPDLFIVFTERRGNNPFSVEAFDSAGTSLGILVIDEDDYSPTGATSLGTNQGTNNSQLEDITAAIYPIADLVGASTTNISYLEIQNTDTGDGGDGKVFLFGDAAAAGVPEPSSTLLVSLGGVLLLGFRRRVN